MSASTIRTVVRRLLLLAGIATALPAWALVVSANFDGVWSDEQKQSFNFAGQTIAGYLPTAYGGETIAVDVRWEAMRNADGTPDNAVLGYSLVSFPFQWWSNFGSSVEGYRENTWYPAALANHLRGYDLSTASEMGIVFNSNFANWYYGLDGKTGGNYDFATVAMHELMHGLGFYSLGQEDGSLAMFNSLLQLVPTPLPSIWDRFVEGDDGHGEIKPIGGMDQNERLSAWAGGGLSWAGEAGNAANGGTAVPIYSPPDFDPGSSLHHLDQAGFPDALMHPFMATTGIHALTAVEVGMLRDIGWVPEPPTLQMALVALLLLAAERCRDGRRDRGSGACRTPARALGFSTGAA